MCHFNIGLQHKFIILVLYHTYGSLFEHESRYRDLDFKLIKTITTLWHTWP